MAADALEPVMQMLLADHVKYVVMHGESMRYRKALKQVVAPFAFVSVLAGALQLFEVMTRLARPGLARTNEWHVSPWREPFTQGRRTRMRFSGCEYCGKAVLRCLRSRLWSSDELTTNTALGVRLNEVS
jgi:hypothetical protein